MAIKIVSKRRAKKVDAPDDLVPRVPEVEVRDDATPAIKEHRETVICTYCKHDYIIPCHGENTACMNRQFIDSKQQRN